jgi:hypothetical protein
MSSAEKRDANGAERFDADPEAWRKQFWGNDGVPDNGGAAAKPNGTDSQDWGEPDLGVLRLRRRPPPALPLEVFGDTWGRWLTDAATAPTIRRSISGSTQAAAEFDKIKRKRWQDVLDGHVMLAQPWLFRRDIRRRGRGHRRQRPLVFLSLAKIDYPDRLRDWPPAALSGSRPMAGGRIGLKGVSTATSRSRSSAWPSPSTAARSLNV